MQAQKQEERLDLQQQGTLFEYIKDSTNITLEVDKLSNWNTLYFKEKLED